MYHHLSQKLKKSTTNCTNNVIHVKEGDFIAVRCQERSLIGKVMEKKEQCVVMDWYIGSYSGTWREWKGKVQGKSVVFFATIENSDILKTVSFTKAMRLNPQTVKDLKSIYSTI